VRNKMALLGLVLTLLVPALAAAEPVAYKADNAHSKVGFTIRHFVSHVDGRFRDFDGQIKYDAQTPTNSTVQFTVQAASIATDNDDRDKHLKSPDFFDVAKFPTLSFTSTKVVAKGANSFDVTGSLTLHGVTKTVTIPATFSGTVKMPKGEKAGFQSSFTVNRLDYGVTWNRAIEGGGAMLGDEVTVNIDIEANRQMAAAAPGK
jgi:polyisoprenoid-binding protein YceI